MMKRYCLLLLLFFSCNFNTKKEILLSEINLETIFENFECPEVFEWHPQIEEALQLFIDILKRDFNKKFTEIVLCNFSHSGETVSHNSFAIFHNSTGDMTVLSFGIDWNIIRKKITIPSVSTEKIISKLSNDGNFTEMTVLSITKEDSQCYFLRNFNYDDYKSLQDLSFFSSL